MGAHHGAPEIYSATSSIKKALIDAEQAAIIVFARAAHLGAVHIIPNCASVNSLIMMLRKRMDVVMIAQGAFALKIWN
jgi:hypothetical protein